MQKLRSIHHLRGLAAFAVLLFHAVSFTAGYGSQKIPHDLFRIGEAGVDVFFVISGFILTLATRSSAGRSAFVLGRLARVGVPYWVIVLALAAMTLIAPGAFRSFSWHGTDLALSLAFVPSIIRDGSIFPLLEPGWTLSLEMLFYALLALALGLPGRWRSPAVCAVLCGLAALGLALGLPQGRSIGWFYTQAILVEFCFGIAIAHLWLAGWRMEGRGALMVLAMAIAAFALAACAAPDAFGPQRVVLYGLPALLLVAGCLLLEDAGRWRGSAVMGFLGDISYSLYLSHVLVLAVVVKLLGGRFAGLSGDAAMLLAGIGATLAVAWAFHRLVEKPALALSAALQRRIAGAGHGRAPAREAPVKAVTGQESPA